MPKLLDPGPSERGWHRIQNVLRCARLYAWKHESEELPRKDSPPLIRGSLLHAGLAHLYIRQQAAAEGRDPDEWYTPRQAVVAAAQERNSPEWDRMVGPVRQALAQYIDNWSARDSLEWKVLFVEHELRARLGPDKKLYTQRADLVVEDQQGRVWIVDHKTAYRLTAKTLDQHILDGQFLGYQHFGQAIWGERFRGVVVNRIRIDNKTGEASFSRRVLEPAPAALSDFVETVLHGEATIDQFSGKEPREWPGVFNSISCYNKYGKCPAFDLCRFGQ